MPRTLYDKIWDAHVVRHATAQTPAVMYVDLHLVHEVTSPQAFAVLRERGLQVRCASRTVATIDHSIPTTPLDAQGLPVFTDIQAQAQVDMLRSNCTEFGVTLHGIGSQRQGIVHVIGPELGLTQPGMTIVCGDSHTSTHGAFGALAFGIGTTEVGYVLATQCLPQARAKTMQVEVSGRLAPGVSAKDIILAIIAQIGVGGGTGYVLEYTGEAIAALSMEERMTVCNMSIEAGARAGMIAPDDTTFAYLAGRERAPQGAAWDAALTRWQTLRYEPAATYDHRITLDATQLTPMLTYGTNPGMGMAIDAHVPADTAADALNYMGLRAGESLLGRAIDVVFIGSCTNGRLSDLRDAAAVLRGRKVANGVRVLVVPGSQAVKKQAEAEGLNENLPASRRRVARARMLHVHRDEWRHVGAGANMP